MKLTIKILRGVLAAVLLLLIGANLWMVVQKSVFHQDPPDIFGYSPLVVTSGSMEPAFSAGDLVIIHRQETYAPGEVVTFRDGEGSLVTHRIIGTNSGKFITKGDANNTEDRELLSPENVVGAMKTYLPGAGSLILFFRSPAGIVVLVLLGVLLIELPYWLGEAGKRRRGRHGEKET